MIIRNKKNTRNRALVATLILLVSCLLAALGYWIYHRSHTTRDTNTVDYSVRSKEDQKQADDKKEEIIKNEKERTPVSQDINIVINRFLQIPSSAVQLRSTVNGTQGGECSATFTSNDLKFTKTFPSEYTGTYWACNIDLASSEFPSSGSWTVSLTITSPEGSSAKPAVSEARIET